MSLQNANSRNDYVGNGAADTYSYTFRIFQDSELQVTVKDLSGVETTLAITTDYTVTGATDASGGTIVLVDASQAWLTLGKLTTGFTLTIRRVLPLFQTTDIRNQGSFLPETHEDVFDKLVMIAQQQQDELNRSVKLPETLSSDDFDPQFPSPVEADNLLIINSAGDAIDLKTADEVFALAGLLLAANNLSDVVDAEASISNLGIDPLRKAISASFSDNQGATPLTGLAFDGTSQNVIHFEFGSNQGAGTKMGFGRFTLFYNGTGWTLKTSGFQSDGTTPPDLTFSFTESGASNKDVQVTLATGVGSGAGNVGVKYHGYLQA